MSSKTTRKKDNIGESIKIDYNTIKAELDNKYKKKRLEIKIDGSSKSYDNFYLIPALCDDRLRRYEGFLLVESNEKNVIEYFSSKYSMGTTGYIIRLIFLFYTDSKGEKKLLIKDYSYSKERKMTKNIDKLSILFRRKVKEFLDMENESSSSSILQQIDKLFDRSDLIEEFYELYKKCKRYISKQIKGVTEGKDEFIDNFMMQMMILWYLQEKGFLNNDRRYFITKFNELKGTNSTISSYISTNLNKFKSYYEFLLYLFDKLQGSSESDDSKQYYEDDIVGRVVIVGPAVFLNGTEMPKGINIPDECFYNKEATTKLITKDVKRLCDEDVPLLNLFESREWTEYGIDEYVIGSLYEKLITGKEKKEKGAYYTPEEITSYICKNTIEPYLVDRINLQRNSSYSSIDEVIENADESMLKFIFKELNDIKIVDPAVGSAHFLESAIDVLLDIYKKVAKKAKDLNLNNFNIVVADNRGELKKIDLTTINDENKFALYVKFFILLARNVYGVDIMPSAINIARARLFLTLARHFNAKEDIYVRFPNIHFNLRVGNSLIGYYNIPDADNSSNQEQITLFDFINNELQHVKEEISSLIDDKEFKDFLINTSKALRSNSVESNIIDDIKKLDAYLSKQYLTWADLKEVLDVKSKLVNILVATLSTKYARILHKLLHCIDEKFNEKLDEKFVNTYKITIEALTKIKRFHWLLHFPEVFLKKGGFDIVIGNPPYGENILTKDEKGILCSGYHLTTDDIAATFLERSIELLRDNGYLSFIITYAITFNKDLSKTRERIYKNFDKCYIATFDRDKCRLFDEMSQSTSIIRCINKKTKGAKCEFYTSKMFREMPDLNNIEYYLANNYLLGRRIYYEFSDKHRLPKIGEKTIAKIIDKLIQNNTNWKTIADCLYDNKHNNMVSIWIRTSGNYWYNAWDKEPYKSSEIKKINVNPEYKSFLLCLINSSLFYLWFRIYGDGRHMNKDILEAFPIIPLEILRSVSRFLDYLGGLLMCYLYQNQDNNKFNTSNVKFMIDIVDVTLGKLYHLNTDEINYVIEYDKVIRGGRKLPKSFDILIDYILFDLLANINIIKNYEFIKRLLDQLCLTAINYDVTINYDRWFELYCKRLTNNITDKESNELDLLTNVNRQLLQTFYSTNLSSL
ncbi:MAG: Eco57I restriction-modification methylase domain-containing protein [Candidatus Nitrosocaldaceae archaeon]